MSQTPNRSPDPIDIQVGQRIALVRERLALTQTDLGTAIGVTFQQVQKYEKGTNRVSASRLVKIADHLDCSIESLFPSADGRDPDEEEALNELGSTQSGRQMARLFASLSPNHRRALIIVAQALASQACADPAADNQAG